MADNNRAPIDPNVKMPKAVLANSAAADVLHQQAYNPTAEGTPPAAPAPAPAPAPQSAFSPHTPAPAAPAPAADNEGDTWEQRFRASEGRLSQARTNIEQLTSDNRGLNDRLHRMEQTISAMAAAPAPVPAAPVPAELTAAALQDRETFGEDFMAAAERAAERVFAPKLAAAQAEITRLNEKLGTVSNVVVQGTREKMLTDLTAAVPNWAAQNRDKNFLSWLSLRDPYSGANRGALLTEAFEQNDTARVITFFKGFLTEGATVAPSTPAAPVNDGRPSLESLAAPGRAKSEAAPPGSPSEKPLISRAEIAQFYRDVQSGKFKGRDDEKNKLEGQIFAAERDGRITG